MMTIALAALLAAAAPAQKSAAPDPATAQVAALLAKEGMSPAGIKTLESSGPALQSQLAGFRARASKIGADLATSKAAGNIEQFGAALRAGDALNAEIQRSRTDAMLHTLEAMNPKDRAIFLRHIGPPAAQSAPQGR